MHERAFLLMMTLMIAAFTPTASAAGIDLLPPEGRIVRIAGAEIAILAEGRPLATIERAPAPTGPMAAEARHVGAQAGAAPEGDGGEVAPVETAPQGGEDGRAARNGAEVARILPWVGALAGVALLVLVCAGIQTAWTRSRAAATS